MLRSSLRLAANPAAIVNGRLNHLAIAINKSVPLEEAAKVYTGVAGATLGPLLHLPEHGVTTLFVNMPNTKIELLHELGDNSPISNFLKKNPNGGLHHICFDVDNLDEALKRCKAAGIRLVTEKKIGAHGKPVVFLHPKDCNGTLTELEDASATPVDPCGKK